jgi:hypothetical protein
MDLDRDAKRILDLATEARTPAAADKARVEQRLAALLGVGVIATTPAIATEAAHAASTAIGGAKAAGGAALKWWIASAVIVSAVTGYVALSSKPQAPVQAPPKPSRAIAAPQVEHAPAPAPVLAAEEAPAEPLIPEHPTTRAATTKKRGSTANADTLGDELELLHRAQSAWRAKDAAQAMTLLDQHRTRFPRSELKLERDGLRVLTLCELGRKPEATSLAHKLLERAPRSPLRATIEESCALK